MSKKATVKCTTCQNEFERYKTIIKERNFCSMSCAGLYNANRPNRRFRNDGKYFQLACGYCKKELVVHQSKVRKNNFCSKSCHAKYQHEHNTLLANKKEYKRSKFEDWLGKQIELLYHSVQIKYNTKDEVGLELDIYLPEFKTAFEINGIFHYKPVYGEANFKKIISKDKYKRKLCYEKNINLITIDTSGMIRYKTKDFYSYFGQVTDVLDKLFSEAEKTYKELQ